ncbi:hypothetical protein KUH03_04695 [Sphingobacterium sp. E70]|uniref:hypothetical protein n=1 Tax=Sphingobacterium sp. E70 TaxID=2853439 RepID=UPI00211C56AC|nr:hypothetical protein [Sphingobacterium sp. E70]ULT26227.1 hypothetical protein KUH03_04695 [Sphingobacterium sp. E70]
MYYFFVLSSLPTTENSEREAEHKRYEKAIILMGVLLIPILFILLNNKDRGKLAADNVVFRDKLSDYGLFKGKIADLVPNDQGVSYELASALFTDYADKNVLFSCQKERK